MAEGSLWSSTAGEAAKPGVDRWYGLSKRLIDVVVSATALIVAAPLMAAIALAIRLDSPGPAIFSQERIGLRHRGRGRQERGTFMCHKFRTMRHAASPELHRAFVQAFIRKDEAGMSELQRRAKEAVGGGEGGAGAATRKLVNDPRVTRVGRFLRRTSLDELPQFWNVLRGEMTLVGPRPALPYEVEVYEPWHHGRLAVKPGLTGLWQVSARSSVDFDGMAKLDLWYIEHRSLWLDLKILAKTPLSVLTGRGAV